MNAKKALVGFLALYCLSTAPPPAQAQAARVQVKSFRVNGNTLLPQATLDAALAPYKGERTLDELKKAAQAVQEAYRDAGYAAVLAYLPAQTSADGVATITVVEGKLGRVVVNGNKRISEDNIRRALPHMQPGITPRVRELDAQIALANENPSRQLAVTLEAGAKAGEVDVRVQVAEEDPVRWSVGIDNTGNSSTGRLRANIGFQHASLWDLDHQLAMQFQTAPEHIDRVLVLSGNYRMPFYRQGLTLDVFGAYSDVDGGTTTTNVGALNFSGSGRVLGMRVGKPLLRWGEVDHRISLGLEGREYLNDCSIAGLPPGACGSAGASVSVQPLTLDYSLQSGGEMPVAASVSLAHNLGFGGSHGDAADFNAVRDGAKKRYTVLRVNAQGALRLPRDWQVQARVAAQATSDLLVPGEQFGIAGAQTLRGYEEREITGDRGFAGSLEVLTPELWSAESVGTLRLLGFVDAGKVWNRVIPTATALECRAGQTSCGLLSTGLGLRLTGPALQVRLDWAHALRAGRSPQATQKGDNRAHVSATYTFR